MNREIKFRVWDDERNEFCYGYPNTRLDEHALLLTFDGRLSNYFGGGTKQKRFEICQFTGMKDKDGVDVYEGDLIKVDMGKNCINTFKVIFENGSFALSDLDKNSGLNHTGFCLSCITRWGMVMGTVFDHNKAKEEMAWNEYRNNTERVKHIRYRLKCGCCPEECLEREIIKKLIKEM